MSAAKKVVTLLRQQWTTWCEADQLLEGAAKQAKDLAALLDRTVAHAESNSQLITGQRGCGKTAVLNAALRELTKKYADQSRPPYLVVHLDGQVLTEDRAALQEIAWQLAVEQQLERQTFGSFAETLAFLLKTLRKSDAKETTPVIFILNEIDQFALHPKQTLLYNLFDIVQSQSSPIAVVGVTCRLVRLFLFLFFNSLSVLAPSQPLCLGLSRAAGKASQVSLLTSNDGGEAAGEHRVLLRDRREALAAPSLCHRDWRIIHKWFQAKRQRCCRVFRLCSLCSRLHGAGLGACIFFVQVQFNVFSHARHCGKTKRTSPSSRARTNLLVMSPAF